MAGKIAKSITITLGSGTFELQEVPWGKNTSCDAVETTSLTDTVKKYIPAAVTDADEFTITILSGTAPTVGTVVEDVALSVTDSSSSSATSVTIGDCIVTKVEYDAIAADGDRKMTAKITLKPTGD